MLCTINDYYLADGTLAGGYGLKNLRLKISRIFDVVVELAALDPVAFDRGKRRVEITFSIQRVQSTITDADIFILDHESTVPRTGDVKLLVSGTDSLTALIVNGSLVSNELIEQNGKETEHAYRIVGSLLFAPTPGEDHIVTEGGDRITTEGGDALVVE